jgi:hypothetical protein
MRRLRSRKFDMEKLEARKSEMNKDHWIWRTYKDYWISVVGQQTMSKDHISRSHKKDYVSKDTWCNQTMTSVKLICHFRYVQITNPSDTWQLLGS